MVKFYCPFSYGKEKPVFCSDRCQWYHEDREDCRLLVILSELYDIAYK